MKAPKGFSLLELLVVLLIIGMAVSVVSLGVTGASSQRDLLRYGEWFAREAAMGLQEAEAEGRHRGATIYRDSRGRWQWQWYAHREGRWQPLNVGQLATTEAPLHTEASLEVDGERVEIAGRSAPADPPQPDIVLFNSGELTPFVLSLSLQSAAQAISICAQAAGGIVVRQNDEGDSPCEAPS